MSNSVFLGPATDAVNSEPNFSIASSSNPLPTATKNSSKPSLETLRGAEKFKNGSEWFVDCNNWEAALLALADKHPRHLDLVLSPPVDACEALHVASVAKAITRSGLRSLLEPEILKELLAGQREEPECYCHVYYYDSFYSATDVAIDKERLVHITANPSIDLSTFFGHLDASTMAMLPWWCDLGLAIGSATDAAAVSSLRTKNAVMDVSVTARVAVEDLKPLPDDISHYSLHFPFLSDDRVNTVRPAIEAFCIKEGRFWSLYLPKCQLTYLGLCRLIGDLVGAHLRYRVTIEPSGTWQPSADEKKRVSAYVRRSLNVSQECSWDIYPYHGNTLVH